MTRFLIHANDSTRENRSRRMVPLRRSSKSFHKFSTGISIYVSDTTLNRPVHPTLWIETSEMERSRRRKELLRDREELPVRASKKELMDLVLRHDTLVLVGETGSGKTTQIPQFLVEDGLVWKGNGVAITQPRRVAATSIASRVAEEMGVEVGSQVGYSVRFEDCSSEDTIVKYMTDGMLLREALIDPSLRRYSTVILDEAHERTLHTDVLFGVLKGVQRQRNHANGAGKRKKLRLIIMSASLDAGRFSTFFDNALDVYIEGRQYPVQIYYTSKPEEDYVDGLICTVLQVHQEEPPGDILAFLTGQEEIEAVDRMIHQRFKSIATDSSELIVRTLFAALPPEEQMKAFEKTPPGARKVILATNIAETSLTIPGVRYVVDPGVVKSRGYSARLGAESLAIVPISKAQAQQRCGRAGREGPGKCFRLYTETAFTELQSETLPEIRRCNLGSVILQLKALGIDDVLGFEFMDPPPRAAVLKALELLYGLGALNTNGKLSDTGSKMSRLPVDPIYARILLAAPEFKCVEEVIGIVAMLSADSIMYKPKDKKSIAEMSHKKFLHRDGDHLTLLQIYKAFRGAGKEKQRIKWCRENFINARALRRAHDVAIQLRKYIEGLGIEIVSCGDDSVPVRKCLIAGLFLHASQKLPDGTYQCLANKQISSIHPSSVCFHRKPNYILFSELLRTSRQYLRQITPIEPQWLADIVPGFYSVNKPGVQ